MGLFDKLFNKNSGADPKVTAACDSDIFENIDKIINEDRSNFDKVIKYLTEKDNVSMKLRVMASLGQDPGSVMVYLMSLDPTSSPKINRVSKDGLNPILHFSMYKEMAILIRVLAHNNADLDVVGLKGHTPLTIACENGNSEGVKMLINNGAKALNKKDDSGWGPLHYACQLGNDEIVESLIKAGADVNAMTSDKLMPVHLAISTTQAARMSPTAPNGIPWNFKNALMCVQHLVNNGADLNYVCPYGFSAMSFLRSIGAVK